LPARQAYFTHGPEGGAFQAARGATGQKTRNLKGKEQEMSQTKPVEEVLTEMMGVLEGFRSVLLGIASHMEFERDRADRLAVGIRAQLGCRGSCWRSLAEQGGVA
jgi:hypothetical protein